MVAEVMAMVIVMVIVVVMIAGGCRTGHGCDCKKRRERQAEAGRPSADGRQWPHDSSSSCDAERTVRFGSGRYGRRLFRDHFGAGPIDVTGVTLAVDSFANVKHGPHAQRGTAAEFIQSKST